MKNCTRIALFNPLQTYSTISDFANIVYTGSNTIAEESLKKILEWANIKFQRYIKLSTHVDEFVYQDSTVYMYTKITIFLFTLMFYNSYVCMFIVFPKIY